MQTTRISTFAAAAIMALLAGCNTDGLWADNQKVEGPRMDSGAMKDLNLPDIKVADNQEVDLVEQMLSHRAMYHRTLKVLRDYYQRNGHEDKRRWADSELAGIDKTEQFKYVLSAEIPKGNLRPVASVAEADEMYNRGLEIMKEGGMHVPGLYRRESMVKALAVFVELIRRHPSSDKIDDAAFFCGEIHKEYLNHNSLAVRWYERAVEWDPNTPHNARFQAAVTYDYRLHDRARALELYRQVVQVENRNKSNVSWAVKRIGELTSDLPEVKGSTQLTSQEMFGRTTPVAQSTESRQ